MPRCGECPHIHPINLYRVCHILDGLRPEVLEVGFQLASDLVMDICGQADPTWFGQSLKPYGDDNAIAVEIAALHHDIAEIYANAKSNALVLRNSIIG